MSRQTEAPIGVFDSGLGGLTVAREIMRNLPMEKIVYFGDTARVPYGNKSKATIQRYARQIVRFLKTQKIKAIVIACNTATAYAIDVVKEEAEGMPVIGVIDPGARVACETTKNGRIGVIATKATIASGAYPEAIHAIRPEVSVIGKALATWLLAGAMEKRLSKPICILLGAFFTAFLFNVMTRLGIPSGTWQDVSNAVFILFFGALSFAGTKEVIK